MRTDYSVLDKKKNLKTIAKFSDNVKKSSAHETDQPSTQKAV